MTVGVDQVLVELVIPWHTEHEEILWEETVLHQDDKVADETGKGLDHTNLTIGHGDKALVDKFVGEFVTRVTLHDVGLGLFVGKGDGRQQISSQVNAQDGDGSEG